MPTLVTLDNYATFVCYLDEIIQATEQAMDEFRRTAQDEDGDGIGTFKEIFYDLLALRAGPGT